ncbi:urease accessory protein UreD [Corynebacterium stationis]|uniref:urease accessory protein UreD n=1 Tax=Corynebacterium stationis TaxID=1705 RepID=UPI001CD21EE6|nr:urease accessory protein UreD [Corynebacterium stationis]
MSTDILGFRAQRRRALAWSGIIFCALIAVLALGVIVGPTPLNIADLGAIASHHLFGSALPAELQTADAIVWDIRLPRLLLGVAVGAGLAVAGAVLQAVVRNMLADPFTLGINSGAALEYVPDQLILYRDADFRQRTVVNMHPQASLFLSDIITPGWSPDGGKFLYKQAHLLNEVHMDGEPVLLDNLRINPLASDFGEVQDFFMDGRTHVATAICFDPGITPELIDALSHLITAHHSPDGSLIAAVTECDKPGFVLRALGNRTEELHALVLATANLVRSQLRGQGKIHLRKY